ncbi:expressed unknown protein [Seminavis robusta]|uniref:Uncharacterized protein n=1 Tax=Seminavis robusta TaxID=568900 RepID=A0A9N8EIP7_9STRA|nr:expressed unknown protein [Seminavis robusta]|eukprot:Sro1061_g236830.1 n/a (173) ;mRNA; r:20324-20842
MLVKAQQQQRPRVDRHRHRNSERRQRLDSEDSRMAESMLNLFREHRRRAQLRNQQVLPDIIASGPGSTVWKRSPQRCHGCVVYQDTQAPHRLLHVIPDDDDADHNRDCAMTRTHQSTASSHSNEGHSYRGKALRRPAPLGYVGIPLPVAPSLPASEQQRSRYLVRPRFPTVQ